MNTPEQRKENAQVIRSTRVDSGGKIAPGEKPKAAPQPPRTYRED